MLGDRSPMIAGRLQWRRDRRTDVALRVVDELVNRGDLVLDIGALHGSFSIRMLDLVGRTGVVHTFEPNAVHHHRLRALPGQGRRIVVHRFALSDRQGQAELHVPTGGGPVLAGLASLESRGDLATRTVHVDVRRLDDVIASTQRVSFIKCDVEGHEDSVIEGGRALLERDLPGILVEIEQRHRSSDVAYAFGVLGGLGYQGWALFPAGLRPLERFDLERDQLSWLSSSWTDGIAPIGYVHNFLFMASGRDLTALVDPAVAPPGAPGAQSEARTSA